MPTHSLRLNAIFTALDNGTRLAGALFYPEVSAYGGGRERLIEEVRRGVTRTARCAARPPGSPSYKRARSCARSR